MLGWVGAIVVVVLGLLGGIWASDGAVSLASLNLEGKTAWSGPAQGDQDDAFDKEEASFDALFGIVPNEEYKPGASLQ